MKKFIANLLTLPYRMWMLALGHMCWCDDCHTIVSNGFGSLEDGKHHFSCDECCAEQRIDFEIKKNLHNAALLDPTNKGDL